MGRKQTKKRKDNILKKRLRDGHLIRLLNISLQ